MFGLVAVVDGDNQFARHIKRLLEEEGYRIRVFRNSAAAVSGIQWERPDVVILDPWLGDPEAGRRVLSRLSQDAATERIPIVLCPTDHGLVEDDGFAPAGRPYVVLEKPFNLDMFIATIAFMVAIRKRTQIVPACVKADFVMCA
jgi:DNA-binding NtrC family response regulator